MPVPAGLFIIPVGGAMANEFPPPILHRNDLPEGLDLGPVIAVDTETMGLNPHRDRLCLVQISSGDGHAHLVQIIPPSLGGRGADCPNLKRVMADPGTVKLMHFAR